MVEASESHPAPVAHGLATCGVGLHLMECLLLRGFQDVDFARNIECGYDIRKVRELL